jgi:hypothetical protein
MARQAEGSEVLKIALASAFDHGNHVVCIPETLSCKLLESPTRQELFPVCPSGTLQIEIREPGIDAAERADAFVARKHVFTEISGIGPQAPLMDAPL